MLSGKWCPCHWLCVVRRCRHNEFRTHRTARVGQVSYFPRRGLANSWSMGKPSPGILRV